MSSSSVHRLAALIGAIALTVCATPAAAELYFVDAHSQMARGLDPATIVPLMDEAGVRRVILSARNDRSPQDVARFAAAHPSRVTAAIRSKGRAFNRNSPKLKKLVDAQAGSPHFAALAEVLMYHAQKGAKAPEIAVEPDAPQVAMLLDLALERGWPFIAHLELAAAGSGRRDRLMDKFEAMVRAHPRHPFALIHMGQLEPDEVARLITTYPNVYFLTSHCNPAALRRSSQPWTNLFAGRSLAGPWKALMIAHPDRFVLAFDNVFPEHWGSFYLEQAKLWRAALGELPPEVANAVAHGNAERLWKLPESG